MSYFQTLGLKADLPEHENPDIRRQTLDLQLNKKYANSLAVVNCRAEWTVKLIQGFKMSLQLAN